MNKIELCESTFIHPDRVKIVQEKMETDEMITSLALFYKAFGDATRLRIMMALSHATMCVCDISNLLQMSQSSISHQLQYLRDMNLVVARRAGKIIYYDLADNHIVSLLFVGLEHIEEEMK